jgi:hypothetical protein
MRAERAPRARKNPTKTAPFNPVARKWIGIRVAGVSGYGRLPAAIPVRDVRGMKYENVAWRATEHAYLQALQETGATGLEPATSGVTGRSWCFRAERG